MPVVRPLLDDVTVVEREPDSFGYQLIDGLPAAAFDMYTREGQQAYRYLKACLPVRRWSPQQIGMMMFVTEGAHLHRHLASKEIGSLELAAKLTDDASVGFKSSEDAVELKLVIREKRALINHARKRVLGHS